MKRNGVDKKIAKLKPIAANPANVANRTTAKDKNFDERRARHCIADDFADMAMELVDLKSSHSVDRVRRQLNVLYLLIADICPEEYPLDSMPILNSDFDRCKRDEFFCLDQVNIRN